jgi:hypothetical protein
MPVLGESAAVTNPTADLVLPCKGRDGVTREYRVKPCTSGELFDLMAIDRGWAVIAGQRWQRIAELSGAEAAPVIIPDDPKLAARLEQMMDGPMSAEDVFALPLGPDVSKAMQADGVSSLEYKLASATAMYWHIAGDDIASQIWSTGRVPGKPAAPPKRSSTSTGTGPTGAGRSRATTSRKKSKRGS